MEFYVVNSSREIDEKKSGVYLIHSNWDDWFKYETSYEVRYITPKGDEIYVGATKIGGFNMHDEKTARIPNAFRILPEDFFSLGTDEAFYEELNSTEMKDVRENILIGLRDTAFNSQIYNQARNSDVFKVSLSRDIAESSIVGRYNRLANGDATLTDYSFTFTTDETKSEITPVKLNFEVKQNELPPSNIHTIIGRNGVGKSYLLNAMVSSLINNSFGFSFEDQYGVSRFSNVLHINFSMFEKKKAYKVDKESSEIVYHHIGPTSKADKDYKFINESGKEECIDGWGALFLESLEECLAKKPRRWLLCINVLSSDPIFRSVDVESLYNNYFQEEDFFKNAFNLFDKLSSGHKIVLLSLCKLVQLSEEKTLIVMDEPEMHLHPPLLSSFIRSLSSLLIKVNGVAILATHSPLVLQEVPRNCVYILNRNGNILKAFRPEMETFGENLTILSKEVFGYEVTDSGFHKILKSKVNEGLDYDEILSEFKDRLSVGASGMLRILLASDEGGI
ncbi:AAA family ATPase [Listeria booriae]|uniref:AAA family ATPase n=1 Tax=Listeria booriae TaxID=1552123 RepID=UPI001623DDFF|nr:AAA family ATPase [Listeria booriae]MBC2098413.1 AAA family ATPase [Listeria booriae]